MSTIDWRPPDTWLRITTTDAHTEGEPFRVVTGGFPDLVGDSILAFRRDAQKRFDPRSLNARLDPVPLLQSAAEVEVLVGNLDEALSYLDRACLAWASGATSVSGTSSLLRPMLCWLEATPQTGDAQSGANQVASLRP